MVVIHSNSTFGESSVYGYPILIMEIVIIILLILLNGVFAMSEMSLVSAKPFKLQNASRKGHSGSRKALELSENPTKFLSTVQIGITLIGILLGVYSGENLTNDVKDLLNKSEWLQPYSETIATVVIVMLITYLSIVLGELLPKRIGMTFPEPIISLLARPMYYLSLATSPFVWLLSASNNLILTILGISHSKDNRVSEEEIKAIIKESAQGGEIQEIEQDIVERVFELGDRKVSSLFTHRKDIVFFKVTDTWKEINEKIVEEKHSAYPLVENSIDNIIGMVLLKDLFLPDRDETFSLRSVAKTPVFVTENTTAYNVLERFKKEKMHYAIVIDEYGSTQGIITMDDVMDALIGDASEVEQDEFTIIKREEGSWLVDGQYSLLEFLKQFDIELPDEIRERYNTVAGMLIYRMGKIPEVGERISLNEYTFEVVDKDGQRIDKILLTFTGKEKEL